MKDVSKQTLERLITFIYCGEVNVGQENVTEFLHMAKELKIKGLADEPHENSNVNHNSESPATDVTGSSSVFNGRQYQSTQTSRSYQQTDADFTLAPNEFENFVDDYGNSNEVDSEYNEPSENDYEMNVQDRIEEKAGHLDGIHGNDYVINSQDLLLGQPNIPQGDVILNGARDDGSHKIQQLKSGPKTTKTKGDYYLDEIFYLKFP